jgi:hypothetical protein
VPANRAIENSGIVQFLGTGYMPPEYLTLDTRYGTRQLMHLISFAPSIPLGLLLAVSDSSSHPSLLTTDFSTTSTCFLYTHEHTLLIECKKHNVSACSDEICYTHAQKSISMALPSPVA